MTTCLISSPPTPTTTSLLPWKYQITVMHWVFWYLSIRTTINVFGNLSSSNLYVFMNESWPPLNLLCLLCLQVCFEYVAEQLDAVESFWTFIVDTLSLSVPFLCVGTAREPITYLDRPHFDFGELLLGNSVLIYTKANVQIIPYTHTLCVFASFDGKIRWFFVFNWLG